jgi:hypothetical protein
MRQPIAAEKLKIYADKPRFLLQRDKPSLPMEYTKDYKKATEIRYNGVATWSSHQQPQGRYINRAPTKEEVLAQYGKSETEIIGAIAAALKDRWATYIYLYDTVTIIYDNAPMQPGPYYIDYFGGPCPHRIKHIELTCKLRVTDNYKQNHDIVLYTAIGKNTGPHPGGNAHSSIRQIEYTDYVRNNLDGVELTLDESLYPICDYDIDGCVPHSRELFYALERENKALKERVSQMENKMNTLMEFIMLMK